MLGFPAAKNVLLFKGYTDMRKSINGLSALVSQFPEHSLFSGDYFVFCSRTRKLLKILYWDGHGMCLWMKRLEKHLFNWPKIDAHKVVHVEQRQLLWLLEGLDIQQPNAYQKLEYQSYI